MKGILELGNGTLKAEAVKAFVFNKEENRTVEISESAYERVNKARSKLLELIEKKVPVYGVTTGFGDSCSRVIRPDQSEELQRNLIAYLSCGTGPVLSKEVSRAVFAIRLQSLSRGFSGVSRELIDRMKMYLERDWIPVIPREGSLGASGDLIPLAYVAQVLQGQGRLHGAKGAVATEKVLKEAGVAPYTLKAKEGLALVNGTSAMAGLSLVNLQHARFLLNVSALNSSWLCMALNGKTEAFGELVNERANVHSGQGRVARKIREFLADENYKTKRGQDVAVSRGVTKEVVQDRYSLRCVPQILGPIAETVDQAWHWLETEINGTSDNPLISEDGNLEMGGNFYGGYLCHGMDYLKICLAQMADLHDRQLAFLIDDKSNRGLPPNLADWNSLPEEERFLHHGLKGLHQSTSAITSEIMSMATPNGIFSRSAESHNQDKVSLGMTAAVRCSSMIELMYTVQSLYMICLAQALDLREVTLKGESSRFFYEVVRKNVPRVRRDVELGDAVNNLSASLKEIAAEFEGKVKPL